MEIFDYFKKTIIENYANFSGRARRREYWFFCLSVWLINVAMRILGIIMVIISASSSLLEIVSTSSAVAMALLSLGLIVPSIAVCVRRLHDIGKSGWYFLLSFIPIIGGIILLIWFCRDSVAVSNKWGANPKDPAAQDELLNAFKE